MELRLHQTHRFSSLYLVAFEYLMGQVFGRGYMAIVASDLGHSPYGLIRVQRKGLEQILREERKVLKGRQKCSKYENESSKECKSSRSEARPAR